jgi:hypothetical protein
MQREPSRTKAGTRVVAAPGSQLRAAVRLLGSAWMPWVGAMPPVGPLSFHVEPRIELDCLRSHGRRWPLAVTLTREALCHGPSLNPLVWAGDAELPTVATGRRSCAPSRHRRTAGLTRDDREQPLRALRRRGIRHAVRRATAIAARHAPAWRTPTRCYWPPALASPRPS